MGAIQGASLCLTGPLHKAINGRICRKMHKNMRKSVTNARGLHQTFINQEESLTRYPALGLLPNGDWTLWVISLKRQGIKSLCWSTQITSQSGLKPSLWQISEMLMLRNLFGRILSLGLGSLIRSSRTIDCSLIVRPSGGIAAIWA